MKKEYDFRKGKRGAVIPQRGKKRITVYVDADIIEELRRRADAAGRGYQTLLNELLRQEIWKTERPLDEATLRRILREELKATG